MDPPSLREENYILTLQQREPISAMSIIHCCFGVLEPRTVLDNAFLKLETLSLSNDFSGRVFPNNFVACPPPSECHYFKRVLTTGWCYKPVIPTP